MAFNGLLPIPAQPPGDGCYNAAGLSEAENYHNPAASGYFSILSATAAGSLRQNSHHLSLLPQVLPILDPKLDTYLSQNEFKQKNRRVVNLLRICVCWVDLDRSKTAVSPWGNVRWDDPESVLDFLFLWHHDNGGPMPSVVISSGRGFHLKWFLERPLPWQALPRWNAVQNALVARYRELGADPQARDASRVLRVIGTTNSKCGRTVTVVYPRIDVAPETYNFDFLAEEVLPYSRKQVEDFRAARIEIKKTPPVSVERRNTTGLLDLSSLNWTRLADLRGLMRLRKLANGGVVPEGQRMMSLFWQLNFLMLSRATTPQNMYSEAAILGNEIDPSWGYRSSELGTVYEKAKCFFNGKKVEFRGKEYPSLYTPRNDTLINLFEITSEEMAWMKTIVSQDEARRRDRAYDETRRRAAGQAPRESYLERVKVEPEAQAQAHRERNTVRWRKAGKVEREVYLEEVGAQVEARRSQAQDLREKGLSYREIAMEMGVSVTSISSYLKIPIKLDT